jgi:Xaa-Pro aminopeptidase
MLVPFTYRRKAVLTLLGQSGLDGLIVSKRADWFYLTGFTGEAGALVVSRGGSTLITDARFAVQAKAETQGIRVLLPEGSVFRSVGEFLGKRRAKRTGFDEDQITVSQLKELRKGTGRRWRAIGAGGLMKGLRAKKDGSELAQMRKAAVLASVVVESACRLLKPGMREYEVAAEIEYLMRKGGASGPAFETIVASGERGAWPHARPSGKRLRKNELVVLDLGVILGHYCSDITRTVYLGKAPDRIRRWYRAVQEAQAAAIASAGNGVPCAEVDAAARRVLAGYKLERYFVHSTGHGVGLEVHEEPRVAKGQERRLEAGNVITVEPGVYVEGIGGIRIEDDVAIHEKNTEVLTRGTRELIEL